MDNNILKVHSFESMAALDGPGLRYAIFLGGCPLRCAYCHNPDTWSMANTTEYTVEQLVAKAVRFKPYFKANGGITITGGEPLMQVKAVTHLAKALMNQQLNVAIDTAGSIFNDDVKKLLDLKPILLLDIKMTDEKRFKKYTGGSLETTLSFLEYANKAGCSIWLRYVTVPTINDSDSDIIALANLANKYENVNNITLLPYHKMGIPKYEGLGIPYTLHSIEPPTPQHMEHLNAVLSSLRSGCVYR